MRFREHYRLRGPRVAALWLLCVALGGAVASARSAAAVDLEPPTISLDLEAAELKQYTSTLSGVPCNGFSGRSAAASGALCRSRSGKAYGGGGHTFKEEFAKMCVAKASNVENCPNPTARAYDHHDGDLEVIRNIYLVNNDGKIVQHPTKTYASVDYSLRSEWLMTFDATDASGKMVQHNQTL